MDEERDEWDFDKEVDDWYEWWNSLDDIEKGEYNEALYRDFKESGACEDTYCIECDYRCRCEDYNR